MAAAVTDAMSKRRCDCGSGCCGALLTEAQLREFLRVEHGSTLPRFDVLAALDRAGTDMHVRALTAVARVQRQHDDVVDRLELDGLVFRRPSEEDRASCGSVTAQGHAHFQQWPSNTIADRLTVLDRVRRDLDALVPSGNG